MENNNYVQGLVSAETKKRLNNHPGYYGKTQREFVGTIVEDWLKSPDARIALLQQRINSMAQALEWARKDFDEARREARVLVPELQARVAALERDRTNAMPPKPTPWQASEPVVSVTA